MEGFKKAGGLAFKKKDFGEAVVQFSKAIELDSKNVTLYGNRSVAYLKNNEIDKAIEDAETCIKLQPEWAKGYVRKGNALLQKEDFGEAKMAYMEGMKQNPDGNTEKQLQAGIRTADSKLQGAMSGMFAKVFDGMWTKLAMNPETKQYLSEPDTLAKLRQLEASGNPFGDPNLIRDPKISKCLSVLLGVNLQAPGGPGEEQPAGAGAQDMETEEPSPAPAQPKQPEPEPEPEPEMNEEEQKKKQIRQKADAEKAKGNAFYKKRNLVEALECYEKAIEIDPTNCMYLSNKASVYMEQKEYKKAIASLEEALKIGNAQNAAYKDKAKILTKTGKCYSKMQDYDKACRCYERSLTEDYSDAADRLLRQTKEYLAKLAKKNYVDPEKSQEHMEKGRGFAKDKKWRDAIEQFTEAYKRDPKNFKALSNRAFVYQKIMDWNNALADCEKCMAMAPDFLKIYTRKVRIEMFLKRYHKALKAANTAIEKATEQKDKTDFMGLKREVMMAASMANATGEPDQRRLEEAQKDPDIRNIMTDPIIQQVLNQMKTDPAATQRALSDPSVASKLEMLIAAGILRTG